MGHMKCICNASLSNSCFPNTMEGEIKGVYEYESRDVWQCHQCGRLWVDVDDPEIKGCHISKSYMPEDESFEHLFKIGSSQSFVKYLEKFWTLHEEDLKKLGITKDKEEILNECIREYQKKVHELEECIAQLEGMCDE